MEGWAKLAKDVKRYKLKVMKQISHGNVIYHPPHGLSDDNEEYRSSSD